MTGNRPHPLLRKRVLDQLAALVRWSDLDYPEFLEAARRVLEDRVSDPRFEFVVYRLWRQDHGEPLPDFEAELPARYERFVAEFPWHVQGAPQWATESRILSTLKFWQRRYPAPLRAESAVAMMASLRSAVGMSNA